jgi:hypothetical protein
VTGSQQHSRAPEPIGRGDKLSSRLDRMFQSHESPRSQHWPDNPWRGGFGPSAPPSAKEKKEREKQARLRWDYQKRMFEGTL